MTVLKFLAGFLALPIVCLCMAGFYWLLNWAGVPADVTIPLRGLFLLSLLIGAICAILWRD